MICEARANGVQAREFCRSIESSVKKRERIRAGSRYGLPRAAEKKGGTPGTPRAVRCVGRHGPLRKGGGRVGGARGRQDSRASTAPFGGKGCVWGNVEGFLEIAPELVHRGGGRGTGGTDRGDARLTGSEPMRYRSISYSALCVRYFLQMALKAGIGRLDCRYDPRRLLDARRSAAPGSFTTRHSSLKIMVARVPGS